MHELSLVEGLVDHLEERLADPELAGRAVVAVRLRVGRDAGVMADAMAFCWEAATTGTALAGSRLDVEEVAGDELVLASLELAKEPTEEPTEEETCAGPAAAEKPA